MTIWLVDILIFWLLINHSKKSNKWRKWSNSCLRTLLTLLKFKTFIETQITIIFSLSVNVLHGDTLTRRTSCIDQFPKVLLMSYWFINIIFHSGTYILCGLCRFLLEYTVEYFSEPSTYIKRTKLPLVNIV